MLTELKTFIKDCGSDPVVLLDTETTGFHQMMDAVVQFSGIRFTLEQDGTISPRHFETENFYIKSPVPMPKEAFAVNGISDEMLAEKGLEPVEAIERIKKFLNMDGFRSVPVIGHNIGFDMKMLNGLFEQNLGDRSLSKAHEWIIPAFQCDTLALARKVVPGRKEDHPHTLGHMIEYIGADPARFEFHNSMGDVFATAQVYNWLVRSFAH